MPLKQRLQAKHLHGGVLYDGLGSAFAAIMSTTPFSSFAQNIGVISLTGVASRHVVTVMGVLLVFTGIFSMVWSVNRFYSKPCIRRCWFGDVCDDYRSRYSNA